MNFDNAQPDTLVLTMPPLGVLALNASASA
jgi:hypothetical protein